jgi:hypothetical protein
MNKILLIFSENLSKIPEEETGLTPNDNSPIYSDYMRGSQ